MKAAIRSGRYAPSTAITQAQNSSAGAGAWLRRSALAATALMCGLLAENIAMAQAESSAAPALPTENFALQEVIVTAQKRQQSINDVPMTITSVDSGTLQRQQINSLADLAQVVPGLSYTTTKDGNPVYTIRGVGFYDQSLAAYPAVSVYVDENPLPFPILSSHSQFDIDRVEVLKGPQGTLFGSNSTGGAINYIASKPTKNLDAGADLTYGRFNATYVDAHVSGPLTDVIASRVAVRVERADGWQTSNSQPDRKNGKVQNFMVRLLTDYAPSEAATFELSLTAWKDKSQTQAPQFIGLQTGEPVQFLSPYLRAAAFSPLTDRAADWTPGIPHRNNNFFQGALRANIAIAPDVTLTSLTSFIKYNQHQGQDLDALPISSLDFTQDYGSIKTITQELRLANGGDGALRWLVGGNFEHSNVYEDLHLYFPESSTFYQLGSIGYPATEDHFGSTQSMRNWAIFTSEEYSLSPSVLFKAGARYTHSERRASECNADDQPPYWTGRFFYDVLAGGVAGSYPGNACFAINNIAAAQHTDPTPVGFPGEFRGEQTEHNISWTLGPQWKPNRNTLTYLTVSKGYKAGSYPTLGGSTFVQYLPVTQESVLAYEVGAKLTLAQGRAQLNAALFYYDYKNKQLLSKVIDPTFGILDALQNIPKSSIRGAELGLVVRPIEALTVNFDATYMRGRIDSFTGFNSAGVKSTFDGTRMPQTPNLQLAADAEFRFPAFGNYEAFVGGGASYRSSTVSIIGGDITPTDYRGEVGTPYAVSGYTLVNLRAGLTSTDGRWRYEVWGKNVFDKYYWFDTLQTTGDTVSRYAGFPASYGVTVGYSFK
ncbi:MAG: TonB-dependent receptor [Acidobacteriota bacterium]|nr:TonB-dependent receptor [Acidobacteriota bacterium]